MTSGFKLGELAVRMGCELRGDPNTRVTHVADLETATSDGICFLANAKYLRHLPSTHAGAVILTAQMAQHCPVPALIAKNPHVIFARVATMLHSTSRAKSGIHPSAIVDSSAQIDPTATIAATCVIGAHVRIAAQVVLGPGCIVLQGASIGAETQMIARVTICERVSIGERCLFHPGVVIGSDGFGNANDNGVWVKVPQVGSVCIGNDVEIGANTTVDRGAIGDTVIEDGVKLDNQIQIAHNVRVGAHTAMAAGVGIAGSTTIGKHCMFAGKVGVAGQLTICDGVVLMGRATVSGSITKPGSYSGTLGLEETGKFRRNAARFRQLDAMAKQLHRLAGKNADEQDSDGAQDETS